jgi:hypothetical protein
MGRLRCVGVTPAASSSATAWRRADRLLVRHCQAPSRPPPPPSWPGRTSRLFVCHCQASSQPPPLLRQGQATRWPPLPPHDQAVRRPLPPPPWPGRASAASSSAAAAAGQRDLHRGQAPLQAAGSHIATKEGSAPRGRWSTVGPDGLDGPSGLAVPRAGPA